MDVNNVTLPTYSLTETDSGELELDLENLSPADTLAGSKLLEIDVEQTSQEEIKQEFCREIKAVSLKYSEPQVVKLKKRVNLLIISTFNNIKLQITD